MTLKTLISIWIHVKSTWAPPPGWLEKVSINNTASYNKMTRQNVNAQHHAFNNPPLKEWKQWGLKQNMQMMQVFINSTIKRPPESCIKLLIYFNYICYYFFSMSTWCKRENDSLRSCRLSKRAISIQTLQISNLPDLTATNSSFAKCSLCNAIKWMTANFVDKSRSVGLPLFCHPFIRLLLDLPAHQCHCN